MQSNTVTVCVRWSVLTWRKGKPVWACRETCQPEWSTNDTYRKVIFPVIHWLWNSEPMPLLGIAICPLSMLIYFSEYLICFCWSLFLSLCRRNKEIVQLFVTSDKYYYSILIINICWEKLMFRPNICGGSVWNLILMLQQYTLYQF